MIIKKIAIKDFKGIEFFECDFGKITNIYGDNGTGKTSVYDAWLWLLFERNSANKTVFEIQPIDSSGSIKHHVETVVTAVIEHDEKEYEVSKKYSEKWSKKRGDIKPEFTGHIIKYFFNSIPLSKQQYKQKLNDIINENIFKILSDPLYFNNELGWKERRKLLLDISETPVKDIEMAEKLGMANLASNLEKYSIDEYMALLKSKDTQFSKELANIPIRIDELSLIGTNSENDDLKQNLKNIKQVLKEVDIPDSTFLDIQTELNELKIKRGHEIADTGDAIALLRTRKRPILSRINMGLNLESIKEELEALRQEWADVYSQEWAGDTICPTCQQEIKPDKIRQAKVLFEQEKAKKIKEIDLKGKSISKEKDDLDMKMKQEEKEEKEIKIANEAIDKRILELEKKESGEDSAISRLSQQLDTMSLDKEEKAAMSHLDPLKKELADKIEAIEEKIAQQKVFEQAQARIAKLAVEERNVSNKLSVVKEDIRSVETFVHQKVSKMESGINEKFHIVQFKLFDDQINGTISETCIATVNGVPYADMNGALKIQAGLDIIKGIFKMEVPIFIDNRESITELPDMGERQIINLIVSPTQLKTEVTK